MIDVHFQDAPALYTPPEHPRPLDISTVHDCDGPRQCLTESTYDVWNPGYHELQPPASASVKQMIDTTRITDIVYGYPIPLYVRPFI